MARWENKEQYEADGSPRLNPHEALQFTTEHAQMAEKLVASGCNLPDLAFIFGTSEWNLKKWKKEHPEFKHAIDRGKQVTLQRLIGAGIKAAEGQTIKTTTITGKGIILADGTVRDLIPGTQVDIKTEIKELPINEKMVQFLANTLSRQLGTEDWVTKNFSETKVSGEVKHKLDASEIQRQIEAQGGRLMKHVESNVIDNECESVQDNSEDS